MVKIENKIPRLNGFVTMLTKSVKRRIGLWTSKII